MRLLHFAVCLILLGSALYTLGVVMATPRRLLGLDGTLLALNEAIVWYSGVPVMIGIVLAAFDLFVLLPRKRAGSSVRFDAIVNRQVTVALTAYNDEASIADAVTDFLAHPRVARVVVVDNNSRDATASRAAAAGAIVVVEERPGYGRCVFRCYREAIAFDDTDLTVLCEGDRTFRAHDIDKFLAYIDHADIVNGTRISEQLRAYETQLSTFMYYGNLFVGKLLEAKHLGRGTFSDVGTTYKLCRNDALRALLSRVDPSVNLEFNAHFLDVALRGGFDIVECPITFHQRVGLSKGGNVNNRRAFAVGLRMIRGILFGWPGEGRG